MDIIEFTLLVVRQNIFTTAITQENLFSLEL